MLMLMRFRFDLERLALLAFFSFTLIVLAFAPILSYFFSVGILLLLGGKKSIRDLRLLFVLNALISIIIVYLSRDFSSEIDHDLRVYYLEYRKMVAGSWSDYSLFAGGLEPGYHVLYSILASVFPNIDEVGLALINVLVTFFLLIFWVERYLLRDQNFYYDAGLIYALVIMFLGFVTFGYLQRQSLSIVFLLYALTARKKYSFLLFSAISVSFHLTSLPLIVLYKMVSRVRLSLTSVLLMLPVLAIFMFFLRFNFYAIIDYFLSRNVTFPGAHKLAFYSSADFSILSMKDVLLNLFLFLFLMLNWNKIYCGWRNIILVTLLLYFSFLGIPLLAERISFILFFLYGFFVYLVFFENRIKVFGYKVFFLVYLFLFCFKNVSMADLPGYEYWSQYSYLSYIPFYYFID